MKHRVWWALARGVLLESARRKDFYVVAIIGVIIMLGSSALGFFGLEGLEIFAKDLAFSVLGTFSAILAVLTASRLVPDEIRNRTLYPVLARPITRFDFLVGKLMGAILSTWISFFVLALLITICLLMFGVRFEPVMFQYLIAKAMGLALTSVVGLTLSCFMTPSAAATMCFVLVFGSSTITRALTMVHAANPASEVVFKFANAVLPQFGLYDFGSRASNTGWGLVPIWVMFALLGYLVVYGGSLLSLSWWRFRSQAV